MTGLTRSAARDERGNSTTAFVVVVVPALLLVAGLAIDGAAQAAAARQAESVARGAARAATDASTTARVVGGDGSGDAVAAARAYVAAAPGITATVSYADGRVTVDTSTTAKTTFLSIIGVDELRASGHAEAEVRARV